MLMNAWEIQQLVPFSVVASALGISFLLPFLKAVCRSKKSWQARHRYSIVQQIAIMMGCTSQHLIHLPVETSSAISSVEREIKSFVNALSQTVNSELLHLDTPLFVNFFSYPLHHLFSNAFILTGTPEVIQYCKPIFRKPINPQIQNMLIMDILGFSGQNLDSSDDEALLPIKLKTISCLPDSLNCIQKFLAFLPTCYDLIDLHDKGRASRLFISFL